MLEAVIDTSIVLKWFSHEREEEVAEARQIYQLLKENKVSLYAPPFLLIETLNILAKKKHVSSLLQKKAMRLIITSGITFVSPKPEYVINLVNIVKKYDITAYDALYILIAKEKKCQLLTVDAELLKIPLSITPAQFLQSMEP